jgi:hypothetical protein
MNFKNILVVTDGNFNDGTGSGITLANLFKGWDFDKLGVYSVKNDRQNGGILKGESCFLNAGKDQSEADKIIVKVGSRFEFIKKFIASSKIRPYLTVFAPITVTDKAVQGIRLFQPEIIYSPVSDIFSIRRLLKIKKITSARLSVVFFDDLIDRYDGLIFSRLYKWMHIKFLRHILSIADATYVCSDAMRVEYELIFGVNFDVVSNPVDLDVVSAYRPIVPSIEPFKIVYAGTVNSKNISNLKLMSEAVKHLVGRGHQVFFEIYTFGTKLDAVQAQFQHFGKNVKVGLAPMGDHELFSILGQASILYIPMDFTKESVKSIRLSYLTKQSLYMALGVPLIVHGPLTIHVVEHALRHKYAEVILEDSVDSLSEKIVEHINDYEKFSRATEYGLTYARDFHCINKVQSKFYKRLLLT